MGADSYSIPARDLVRQVDETPSQSRFSDSPRKSWTAAVFALCRCGRFPFDSVLEVARHEIHVALPRVRANRYRAKEEPLKFPMRTSTLSRCSSRVPAM